MICGLMTDIFGHRWRVNIFMGLTLIVSAAMLLAWDISTAASASLCASANVAQKLT